MLKAIDDASSRDVIEKTNRIERHVRWKEYAALCLKKHSQVPKQLLSSQSYQDIIQEHLSGRTATTNMSAEFPDILSKNQIREERTWCSSFSSQSSVLLYLGYAIDRH